ncbi:hypothetical protein ASD00_36550 [Ensifer sp. Root31]|uniref:DUF6959 family protein n=1 Tax=Ensifer sp. Root31 TaxID=1736512 RepID=UPI00070ABE2B|nr:hypothetical protein [Ensifer sp. Root31]KQU79358.1 hypothetical protein ASD00_36550 [Ensifer sp. Root31]
MKDFAELLTESENYAVVQLPDRKFPGIVFQGDSLHSLSERMIELHRLITSGQSDDADFELSIMIDDIKSILTKYERVLISKGMALPYAK